MNISTYVNMYICHKYELKNKIWWDTTYVKFKAHKQ